MCWESTQLITYERLLVDIPEITPKKKVRIHLAEPRHMKELTELVVVALKRRYEVTLRARLRDGDLCFLAEDGRGNIAGFCWVVFQHTAREVVREIPRALSTKLQGREVLLYDALVVPELRRNRIYEKLLEEALRYLRKKQYIKAYAQIESKNIPSRKAIVRLGFKAKNTVTMVTVLGHRISSEKALKF